MSHCTYLPSRALRQRDAVVVWVDCSLVSRCCSRGRWAGRRQTDPLKETWSTLFITVEFSFQCDDFMYFVLNSLWKEATLSYSRVFYRCAERRLTDWPGAALPLRASPLINLLLALLRMDWWIIRRLLELAKKKLLARGVWTSVWICRRLGFYLWSLMQFAQISSHRLVIGTSFWIRLYHWCRAACLTNCEDCDQP